jgi:hypothetical protein
MTPQLDAALASLAPTVVGAIEILLPDHALRLIDGAGRVTIGGNVFLGRDPTYGTIDSVDVIADGTGDEAPEVRLTLLPASDAAAASLASATMQGSQVSIWLAALDPVSGLVIPDPLLVFLGELDVPTLKAGEHRRELEYSIVSVFEKFFADDEGARLSDTFHQSVWPGEKGFAFVTGADETIYWGADAPPSNISYGGGVTSPDVNNWFLGMGGHY